ncbi:MAG: hypothetical protein IJB77_07085, partial [Bacteroidaceae bacterium]|nr:hypothetical protein [Bacteroidaceae bacterium]
DTLWEPGKTQVVYLSIKNNGSLDLKYKVALDVKDADADQNLYEVMKYAITNDAKYGAVDAWDAAKGVSVVPGVNATQANDVALKAGEEHFFALSVHMDEAAGNQYQGGEVDFDIRVLATQLASEFDSFNNQYDKDAVYGDVMVSSDAELKAAIEDPAMKVIAVNGDLTYDWGSESYENSKALNMKGKTFLGANDAASITFAGYGSANPIVNATFKDITIKDITKGDNESSWEHGYLEFKNLTAVNVTFANSIMMEGDFATFKNCSFNSNKDGEYAVWVANGDATFEGCTFTGPRGVKVHEAYGSEVGTVVIDNNTFAGLTQKPGVVIGTVDATTKVTIKNSTFVNCQAGDQGEYIYESDTNVNTIKFTNENNNVYNNAQFVGKADELIDLNGVVNDPIILTDDLTFSANNTAANSGYGATGVSVNGGVLDGNGKTLTVNDAWNTWDCAVNVKGGTIKNLTINSAMRGIFMGSATADVYIDNVVIDGTVYTFNSDGGSKNYGVYISNSTLNGWTSHSDVHKEVVYTNCNFGEGSGYAYCRPYGPTTFKNCAFEAGFAVDAVGQVTFENCTIGGVALTADNLATLVTTSNIANATVK